MTVGLDKLVGQREVARRLDTLIARGRLPHALLFSGPAGVGKLAAAHLLAQILMCSDRKPGDSVACDVCPGCHKVKEGLHADVHIVTTDARSLKVDEIREATKTLHLRPMEGLGKVLIIHGADRMTIEAQNALLKTLEEPPGTAYLVLTTARQQLILPTVLSRCQRVPFHPIARAEIASLLAKERGVAEQQALLVASMSQGSLETALAIDAEQLVERRDKVAILDQRLEAGRKNAVFEALEISTELGEEREDLEAFLDLLQVWLHDQVLLASGADESGIANIDRLADLEQLVERRGLRAVLERTRAVLHAKRQLDLPFNLNRQMIAEQLCLGLAGQLRVPDPVPSWRP